MFKLFCLAENCYNRAIQFDDKEPEFLFHRGKLFLFQKKYEVSTQSDLVN